jgi:hypothetical protein
MTSFEGTGGPVTCSVDHLSNHACESDCGDPGKIAEHPKLSEPRSALEVLTKSFPDAGRVPSFCIFYEGVAASLKPACRRDGDRDFIEGYLKDIRLHQTSSEGIERDGRQGEVGRVGRRRLQLWAARHVPGNAE